MTTDISNQDDNTLDQELLYDVNLSRLVTDIYEFADGYNDPFGNIGGLYIISRDSSGLVTTRGFCCPLLNLRIFEELLRNDKEIAIELRRLAGLNWNRFQHHRLRILIKMVLATQYIEVHNQAERQREQEILAAHEDYIARHYEDCDEDDAAAEQLQPPAYTVYYIADDQDIHFISATAYITGHVALIAEWCMADFSQYPQYWCTPEGGRTTDTSQPLLNVKSIWELAEEAKASRVADEQRKTERNKQRVKVSGKYIPPEERAEHERQQAVIAKQKEQQDKLDAALERQFAIESAKAQRKLEKLEQNPDLILYDKAAEEMIVTVPVSATELAKKLKLKLKGKP